MSVDVAAKERKAALRSRVEGLLAAVSDREVRAQSEVVTAQVLRHPRYLSAQSVSLYLSAGKELSTTEILRAALDQGKACYVPRYTKANPDMEMVRLHSMEDYEALPLTRWNIKQPRAAEARESVFDCGRPDVVLVPGVAFSREGARLGHGKGYYDRFLARCRRDLPPEGRPWVVGLALRQQVLPEGEVPLEATDQRLDLVAVAAEE